MNIYLYPLDSLDDLQVALDGGCREVTLFDATPQNGWRAFMTEVSGSDALGVVSYAQDYLSLTNYALLFGINEVDPCETDQ